MRQHPARPPRARASLDSNTDHPPPFIRSAPSLRSLPSRSSLPALGCLPVPLRPMPADCGPTGSALLNPCSRAWHCYTSHCPRSGRFARSVRSFARSLRFIVPRHRQHTPESARARRPGLLDAACPGPLRQVATIRSVLLVMLLDH